MEYKRLHVGEEEEDEEEEDEDEEEEEEIKGSYTAVAPGAHGQVLGPSASSSPSILESAAFSRPLLPPNSSLVSPTHPFLSPHQHQHHPRRVERERERPVEAREGQQHQESSRNGVVSTTPPPPASTLARGPGGASRTASPYSGDYGAGAAAAAAEVSPWRYRECLRNHAARLGAHVLDGCGEFMPSPGDGGAAMACAACGCHRSFHRREPAVPSPSPSPAAAVLMSPSAPHSVGSSRLVPLLLPPPHMQKQRPLPPPSPSPPAGALTESSSEELRPSAAPSGEPSAAPTPSKKRFRTKFTAEQKERMREFAHRVGWRIQKPDGGAVDAFCAQVGVSRRVLKVWMHNNKHLAKTPPQPPPPPPPPPQPPQDPHHHHHPQPQQQQQHDA